jgi:hypothetical protein
MPTSTPSPSPTTSADTCVSTDPDRICLGLKLVSYVDRSTGKATIDETGARTLASQINDVWNHCDIGFQLEIYQAADPLDYGLDYGSASESELSSIRSEFKDPSRMLVVVTGPWTGSTIAWTNMPGSSLLGTIVDQQYGHNPFTVGHELGHYQGLYHVSDNANLMNPYIGTNTSGLTTSQCNTARSTDQEYWAAMMRY